MLKARTAYLDFGKTIFMGFLLKPIHQIILKKKLVFPFCDILQLPQNAKKIFALKRLQQDLAQSSVMFHVKMKTCDQKSFEITCT